MIVGLLLAAGLSRRFGSANKLLHTVHGQPMIAHAASVMRTLLLDHRLAVTADEAMGEQLEGFTLIHNPHPEQGLGLSLALGARTAQDLSADRLLVMLADMPFVTEEHCQAVIDRCSDQTPSASTQNGRNMPPACFPGRMLETLASAQGDSGARHLIAHLPQPSLVEATASTLEDIDTVEQIKHMSH